MGSSDESYKLNPFEYKVADHISAMLAYWDKNLLCKYANAAYADWFGKTKDELINKMTIDQLLGPVLFHKNLPFIKGALAGKPQTFERTIPRPGGGERHSLANYFPDIENGAVKGFFVHVADISVLETTQWSRKSPHKTINGNLNEPMGNIVMVLQSCILTGFPGIANLAKLHHISKTSLKRDFKRFYNTTPFAYYRGLQMELAEQYLRDGIYNKKQLAALFNFSNPSNFYSLYKKYSQQKELTE